jgi:hypothetical protein
MFPLPANHGNTKCSESDVIAWQMQVFMHVAQQNYSLDVVYRRKRYVLDTVEMRHYKNDKERLHWKM